MSGIDKNTLLMLHGDSLTDDSPYDRVITNNGVTVSTAQSKFGGKSLYFNGSSAYLEVQCLITGGHPFTIDCWAYPTAKRNNTVWSHGGTNVAAVQGGGLELFGEGTAIYYCSGFLISGGSYTVNAWQHIALVGDGSRTTLYMNGKAVGTYTGGYDYASYPETIGANASVYGQENFQGYIDELRISDIARWTADFTPPTEAYSVPLPPSAPEAVRTALSVLLRWNASTGADSYNIYRDGVLIGTTTAAQYIDTTAEENETYTYAVSAVGIGGESARTEIIVYTRTGYFQYKPYIQSANFR